VELNLTTLAYALLGGILPAIVWLTFWLRQDNKKPEPKIMILIAFIGGVIAVFGSLYLEKISSSIDIENILQKLNLEKIYSWLKDISIKEKITLNRL
jgi:RsiW-degrading membrane proteinase PrsW (M82 family)